MISIDELGAQGLLLNTYTLVDWRRSLGRHEAIFTW